jgi:oligoendopeptidase F
MSANIRVYVVTYRRRHLLERALRSLLAQLGMAINLARSFMYWHRNSDIAFPQYHRADSDFLVAPHALGGGA